MLARKDTEKFPRFFKVVGKYPDFQVFKPCQSFDLQYKSNAWSLYETQHCAEMG